MKNSPRPPSAPAATAASAPAPGKALRSDGVEARHRLLDAALLLFAAKGFAKTSTRAIAQAAQVNIASISYYFGDKAGLYRAVFTDPRCHPGPDLALLQGPAPSLREVLRTMLRGFTEALKQGDLVQCCMRLHFREMLEPTGVWHDEIHNSIVPAHKALVAGLCTHLEVKTADDDIHRLALALTGLGLMVQVCTDVTSVVRPGLIATPEAVDLYADRLLAYAEAMVESEARRRAGRAAP